jgi:hypothetical protein
VNSVRDDATELQPGITDALADGTAVEEVAS